VVRFELLLCLTLVAGCSGPVATVQRGVHPTIVSLNPCSDAILAEVARPGQLLAISHYSHDLRATSMAPDVARQFGSTGGTVEEVLALNPDVVVAGSFLPQSTQLAFERLGIRVETIGIASSVEQSEKQVRELAALAGNPVAGDALNRRIEAALQSAQADKAGPLTLVWQQGGIVAGPDSLVADLLGRTGFRNHAAARGLGQGAFLSLEEVLADPPDLVLAAGGERMLAHPALRGLASVRYRELDPSLLYCGGPTIIRAAARLREIRDSALHKPLPHAGGVWGGQIGDQYGPPPAPPLNGRGEI
jgi:iron complex transport system substrate-binding protein